jgi:hypothetical protein
MSTTITTPSIDNYGTGQANSIVVTDSRGIDYYFSYRTVVAFRTPDHGLTVRRNEWGPTTGKHLTWIDGGSKDAKAARVDGDTFARLLAERTA